jgi:ABC-type glutathione transport system ATPase component
MTERPNMAANEPEGFDSIVKTPSRAAAEPRNSLARAFTNSSILSKRRSRRSSHAHEESEEELDDPISNDWSMMPELKAFQKQGEKDAVKGRKLGVTWRNLTVKGIGADSAIMESVASQFDISQQIKDFRHKEPLKTILDDTHGCVKPGEMLLVLGRPGSGCTSLLKILANRREGYAEVTGDVSWGSLNPKEVEQFRGQVVMNTEEELFYPGLTVGQTIDFATRMKSKSPYSTTSCWTLVVFSNPTSQLPNLLTFTILTVQSSIQPSVGQSIARRVPTREPRLPP